MFIIPYRIETLEQKTPYANWAIIAACVLVFLGMLLGHMKESAIESMVLSVDNLTLRGLIGHIFVHAGILHLAGNMIFLWVFGNAICTNTNNIIYPILFLILGLAAAVFHMMFDGRPAVGASGAINGIVGLALAIYPNNRVHMIFFVFFRPVTFSCKAWLIFLCWFAFDIYGASTEGGGIAYWAHIGGFITGVAIGLACLQVKLIEVTRYDGRTLLEILQGSQRKGCF